MAREIVMPRLSDSMEEGTILKWLVAAGDAVSAGRSARRGRDRQGGRDPRGRRRRRPCSGCCAGKGASVAVGAPIMVVGEAGRDAARPGRLRACAAGRGARRARGRGAGAVPRCSGRPRPARGRSRRRAAPRRRPPHGGRVKASPLARRIAAELGVELATLAGSGPQGRVIRADVERGIAGRLLERAATATATGATDRRRDVGARRRRQGRASTRHALTTIQRTVARRMAESRATVPDIELRAEVDMSAAVALREQLRALAADRAAVLQRPDRQGGALAPARVPARRRRLPRRPFETYGRVNVGIAVAAPRRARRADRVRRRPQVRRPRSPRTTRAAGRPRPRRLDHARRARRGDVQHLQPRHVRDRQLLRGDQPAAGRDPRGRRPAQAAGRARRPARSWRGTRCSSRSPVTTGSSTAPTAARFLARLRELLEQPLACSWAGWPSRAGPVPTPHPPRPDEPPARAFAPHAPPGRGRPPARSAHPRDPAVRRARARPSGAAAVAARVLGTEAVVDVVLGDAAPGPRTRGR